MITLLFLSVFCDLKRFSAYVCVDIYANHFLIPSGFIIFTVRM